MVEVYYYVPQDKVVNCLECGLKLSEWHEKEVHIGLENKKCFSALLNPKDDMDRYKSSAYRCVKLELYPRYCFVADSYLYELGLKHPEIMDLYIESVMPIENYTFGLYRLPECLVTTTVIPDQISLLDRRLDSPILFNSSEELYINNVIEEFKQEYDDLNDRLLYCFLKGSADEGKLELVEEEENSMVAFVDKKIGRAFTIRKPLK